MWTSPALFSYRLPENVVKGYIASIKTLCYGSFKQHKIVLNNQELSQGVRSLYEVLSFIGCTPVYLA